MAELLCARATVPDYKKNLTPGLPMACAFERAKVNGKTQQIQGTPGSYLTLQRKWKTGDKVDIRLPMTLHQETLPNTPSTIALLYGPIVLAGELGKENMPSPYAKSQTDLNRTPSPQAPVFISNTNDVIAKVQEVKGKPLTFVTRGLGQPQDVTLIPFYQMHHQRYSVYWQVLSDADWQMKKAALAEVAAHRKALEARMVDEVRPGEQQPETDHNFKGDSTQTGEFNNRKWRDANNGGWFSYDLKVLPDTPQTLRCTYWGSDVGGREFDILVDGVKLASQTLDNNKPDEFFTVDYPIPAEILKGKQKVTIRFNAHEHKMAGGVFTCAILKAQQ